jgi:hypothetical protein
MKTSGKTVKQEKSAAGRLSADFEIFRDGLK